MGQYRRHLAILLGAVVVVCCAIIGVRWARLADRVELANLEITATSYAQEEPVATPANQVNPSRPVLSNNQPVAPAGQLDLNSASQAELEELPGIGPVLAQSIVEYRNAHGPFRSLLELDQVSGIGAKKLAAISELVVINAKE